MDIKKLKNLRKHKFKWLVTGVSGFIGKNILNYLILNDQIVIGFDKNTIDKSDYDRIFYNNPNRKKNFIFIKQDLTNSNFVKRNKIKIDFVLHHAASSSVPLSIKKPKQVYDNNVKSFINILEYCRINEIKKVIYASSSALYSDKNNTSENIEINNLKSVYAESKLANESIANLYSKEYRMNLVGLRYFNVYGPFCKKKGMNLPVINNWIKSLLLNKNVELYGSKNQTRDFIYVKNIVELNILLSLSKNKKKIYNIGTGKSTNLNNLFKILKKNINLKKRNDSKLIFLKERSGDIKYSRANLRNLINEFKLTGKYFVDLNTGLKETINYFIKQ